RIGISCRQTKGDTPYTQPLHCRSTGPVTDADCGSCLESMLQGRLVRRRKVRQHQATTLLPSELKRFGTIENGSPSPESCRTDIRQDSDVLAERIQPMLDEQDFETVVTGDAQTFGQIVLVAAQQPKTELPLPHREDRFDIRAISRKTYDSRCEGRPGNYSHKRSQCGFISAFNVQVDFWRISR